MGHFFHLLFAQRASTASSPPRRCADEDQDLRRSNGEAGGAPALPEGDINGLTISPGETKMAFYHDGARSPANLFVYDFATKKPTKLTESLNPEINAADLVESRVIRYKSFDGLEIPAILYTPHEVDGGRNYRRWFECMVGRADRLAPYSASVQFLVNHGYVLLDVNNRGSSG